MLWLNKHLPILEDHIIVTPDKGCIGTKRDFLIDDHPEWANAHKFPGKIIKFGGEHNDRFYHTSSWENLCMKFKDIEA